LTIHHPDSEQRTLVVLASHSSHERNVIRHVSPGMGIKFDNVLVVHRLPIPILACSRRALERQVLGVKVSTLYLPRLVDGAVVDPHSIVTANFCARQVKKHAPKVSAVVVGELDGEIAILHAKIQEIIGAPTVFVPEGTGVVLKEPGRYWRLLRRKGSLLEALQRVASSTLHSPSSWLADPQAVKNQLLKLSWRIERVVSLLISRDNAPEVQKINEVALILSEWLSKSPPGLTTDQIVNPLKFPEGREAPVGNTLLFLHGPYPLSTNTWRSLLQSLYPANYAGITVKSHRNSLGFNKLLKAAHEVFPGAVISIVGLEPAESLLAAGGFRTVASIDSTVLVSAAESNFRGEVVSVLGSLRANFTTSEQAVMSRYRHSFDMFLEHYGKRITIV